MRTFFLSAAVLIIGIVCIQAAFPRKRNAQQNLVQPQSSVFDTSKLINWSVRPGNAFFLRDANNELYLYVQVVSGELKHQKARTPLNVSLVLDRSGSMRGDKIKYARQAAKFLVDQLNSEDYLSIVNYDNEVQVTSASQQIKNKEYLRKRIDEITDRGSTNLSGGMLEGYTQVKTTKKEGYVNRVLLLTDGLANAGITAPDELRRIVEKKYTEDGIALSTFGLGADYNEDLLTMLAENGRANYYFIDSPDKIPALFASELKGLLSVIAQNALVEVELPRGVKCEKVFVYPYEIKDNKVQIRFNDIYAKDEKSILIKLSASPAVHEALNFQCKLKYTDAQELKEVNQFRSVQMQPVTLAERIKEGEDKQVQEMIALFESTEEFDKMMADVDAGNYDAAKRAAAVSIQKLESKSVTYNSAKLKEQTVKVKEYALRLDSVRVMKESEKSMYQKNSKSINYKVKNSKN